MFGLSRIAAAALAAAALVLPAVARAGDATPLFASEATIKLRIEAPFADLISKAQRSTDPYDAKIKLLGTAAEEHPITLEARGISRRKPWVCDFPPLRIQFKEKPGAQSLFKGQKTLKLSTHCRAAPSFQDYSLLEYAAYRLYNALTLQSFRVRLAEIEYAEAKTGALRIKRYGFLIEDADDMAERNDQKKIEIAAIERRQLNSAATARSDLFQYMIGNLDWSDIAAPQGQDCCHNIKLLGAAAGSISNLVPVPYDFDSSGLVNAPYALPPPNVPVRSVRTRYYRGYCEFNSQVKPAAAAFLAKRDTLLASIASTPMLSDGGKAAATQYLNAFFNQISDAQTIKRRITDYCRN
ncbi:MAG: hypothetical protein U1E87_03410 [Alphaproteobacteria bacterium]